MPGGMELDHVAAAAIAIEALQNGRVAVRLEAPFDRLGAAERGAEGGEAIDRPQGALARDSLAERAIAGEEIVIDERRRLVEDIVRGEARRTRQGIAHGGSPLDRILHMDRADGKMR